MAEESGSEADRFFNWMERSYGDCINDIKLKILEFVLMAEHIAYESGGMVYHFTDRADYLETVMGMNHPEDIVITSYSIHYTKLYEEKHEIKRVPTTSGQLGQTIRRALF